MSGRISPNTLENLKREAKRWLKALRANVREARARLERALPNAPALPTLRDVQHAVAREHGFAGWTALKTHLATSSPAQPTLERYEEMAEAMLDAYRTGTPDAMERHWNLTWHRRNWQAMRTYVQLDLGRRPDAADSDVDISLDDARFLIAREHGFESWRALTEFVAAQPAGKTFAASPIAVSSGDERGNERAAQTSRDWDAIIALVRHQRLSSLNANGQMTDEALDRISHVNQLTTLHLQGSKHLTDIGLRHLARLPQLRHLDLGGCAITDRGIEVLRDLPELETISLAWTAITDAGVAHLARCDRLERVNLSGTRTGDGAIQALTDKPQLRTFNSGNRVTDAGIALLHQFPVFKHWHGGETSMGLTSYDAGPDYLALRGSFTDQGLAKLVGLDGLFALNVDDSNLAITGAGLAPLVSLANLGWLAFDATDDAMPYIAAMPKLRFLGCQDTVAGDDGFVALSRSQSIEYIWGRRCYNLRSRGFSALATMPALRALSVSCKNVDDAGLSALPHFPALRELMPMDVPDEGYRHVGRCDGLESLVLMYCRDTTDVATEYIARLPRLQKYFASYTRITDRTPEILGGMSSLEEIALSGCVGVSDAGIAALAALPRLRKVRLSGMPKVTALSATAFSNRVQVEYSP